MQRKPIFSQQIFKSRRRDLRNNATSEEKLLWNKLRRKQLGSKVYRQYSIGPYIADFYCPSKKIVIELDGNQHVKNYEYDQERSDYLESLGMKVLRFWNHEVDENLESVLQKIQNELM